ncbi:MAG: Fur family transcriptional regulator [Deltaproteobacteria bacterium]|nr:MAG: Fur family transcriptional regulator [Deltaproteobacteria bacterium]
MGGVSNQTEKANFRSLLEADGAERLEDKLNIIDVFLSTEGHITFEELMEILREKGYDYDRDFVRQTLDRMVELGFAQRKKFESQPIRYEHRHLGRHHDHLICTKCGKIIEFNEPSIEQLQLEVARRHGFQMLQHKMEIYGLCSECTASRKPLMPLSMAKAGEKVVITDIVGGVTAKGRLASMGLRRGDSLEIISNDGRGRLILAHDCTRLALGRGMAQKILVSPSEKHIEPTCKDEDGGQAA